MAKLQENQESINQKSPDRPVGAIWGLASERELLMLSIVTMFPRFIPVMTRRAKRTAVKSFLPAFALATMVSDYKNSGHNVDQNGGRANRDTFE